jgi:hypothetical protein
MSRDLVSPASMNPALTREQRATFERDGVVRLDGVVPADLVAAAQTAVRRPLEAAGFWRDGAWRLDALPRPVWPDHGVRTAKTIGNKHPELEALMEAPAIRTVVDELLEGREIDRRIYPRPQVLFTLPNAEQWMMTTGWHTDAPRLASRRPAGVQVFTFLDHVAPRGGGTLVIAGSHRLLNDGQFLTAKHVHRLLGREPFFRQLWTKRPIPWADDAELPSGAIDNLPLRVMELTGAPGDAWLMDLRTLHNGAPNAGDHPRLMVTYRFVRRDVAREIAEGMGWIAPKKG